MLTIKDNFFYDTAKNRALSVHAKQNRAGRWQFRMNDAKGKVLASGTTPAEFARSFWYRDDFTETMAIRYKECEHDFGFTDSLHLPCGYVGCEGNEEVETLPLPPTKIER